MNYDQPELLQQLAGEFVLGTLPGTARRRFVRVLEANREARRAVADWEARLMPLAYAVTPVEPPAYVWGRIAARVGINVSPQAAAQPRASFWDSLNFWRPLAVLSSAAAFGLLFYLSALTPPATVAPPLPSPEAIAVLAGKEAKAVMLVAADSGRNQLTVTILSQEPIADDRDFELWALPEGGAPQSLGVVAARGVTRLKLPPGGVKAPAMAISLEPKGGSTTGAPTGPVLYQGAVVQVGT